IEKSLQAGDICRISIRGDVGTTKYSTVAGEIVGGNVHTGPLAPLRNPGCAGEDIAYARYITKALNLLDDMRHKFALGTDIFNHVASSGWICCITRSWRSAGYAHPIASPTRSAASRNKPIISKSADRFWSTSRLACVCSRRAQVSAGNNGC